jgi:hypothetical protein
VATDKQIAEAEELASLLGKLHPAYATLVARSDFRTPLTKLADKLAKQVGGTPVAAELKRAKANLEEVG